MNGTAEREATRRQLIRIAALLLALAALAERACRASPAVRFLVLVLLRPAEAVVRDFIGGPLPEPCIDWEGYDPAAALRLAESLVALAIALVGFAEWLGACGRVPMSRAHCPAFAPDFPGVARLIEAFDSS